MATATRTATPNRSSRLTLTFGLVNVPISMKPLNDPKSLVAGKMTCPQHGPVLNQQYVCSAGTKDEHVIANADTVKSYPHPDKPNEYVILDSSVIDDFAEERTGFAQIERVIDASTIDAAYFDKVYLVWPGDGGEQSFDLFTSVLRQENKAAVTTTVISKRTRIIVFRWSEEFGCLLGHIVRFVSEMRLNDATLVRAGAEHRQVDKKQYEVAKQLLDGMEGTFDPSEVEDTYTILMAEAIKQAASGKKPVAKAKASSSGDSGDLMDALVASLKKTTESKTKPKPRARAKT